MNIEYLKQNKVKALLSVAIPSIIAMLLETACGKYGWILGYTIHPGNEHDSTTVPATYEKIKKFSSTHIIADAGL